MHPSLLQNISQPRDLKRLSSAQIQQLCGEIRQFLLDSVSKTGGHLASNLGAVELRLNQELEKVAGIRDLVLVMSAVNLMDATAVEVLCELNRDLAGRRIRLHLAEVKGPIQDRLMRTGLWSTLSGEVFLSANDAFEKLGRI